MALRFPSSSAATFPHLLLCHLRFCKKLYTSPSETPPAQPPEDLVNELSRILSDFRSPHHDIHSALNPFSFTISTNLVEQVLKRCKNLGFSAHRFFLWAKTVPGFKHSEDSHHMLIDILGGSKQFPLLWDFLAEVRNSKSCEISQKIFWLVFRAYSRANLPADATRAFCRMLDFGIQPNLNDLDQLLLVLCKRKHVKHAQEFFDGVKDQFLPSVKTYSILIRGWGDVGEPAKARELFDEMRELGCSVDLLAYNSVLESLCKSGNVDDAYSMFRKLGSQGFVPDVYSYSIFIHAFCEASNIHSVFRVLDRMKRYNLVPNVFTYSRIIKMLCMSHKVEEAYELLDEMLEKEVMPDVWCYNSILSSHCDQNEVNRTLKLTARMREHGCQFDRRTYNMVLKMLVRVGRFDKAEEFWESMGENGFYPSVSTYSVMVHGLCKKKDKLDEACKYFEMMIDEGIPPYRVTCDLLRHKLTGMGFAERRDILTNKMKRSTSCAIQELSDLMCGTRAHAKPRFKEEYSDESDM